MVTTATLKCVDIDEEKVITKEFVLPREYSTDNHIIKKVEEILKREKINLKPINVLDVKTERCIFCMTEEDFIAKAVKLNQRVCTLKKGN